MERYRLKIGVLTSSRADFGIYQPLLLELRDDHRFELEIIAFGTHLSPFHGYTIEEIQSLEFSVIHKIFGMPLSDTAEAIANAYGLIVSNFSQFWARHSFDWVLALGDRFEMAAAVQAGIPMNVKFAHLHGGETTLGSIDNIFRHQITLASSLHFTATEAYGKRIAELVGNTDAIHYVGALSLDGIDKLLLPKWKEVAEAFNIPVRPFILVTFHPETVFADKNGFYSKIAGQALQELAQDYLIVITMPNVDTAGSNFRHVFFELHKNQPDNFFLIEHFGRLNYFAALRSSLLLLGNTSSGIIEAASFGKYVVNVGYRQYGRQQGANVVNVEFDKTAIVSATKKCISQDSYVGENIYYRTDTVKNIIEVLSECIITKNT